MSLVLDGSNGITFPDSGVYAAAVGSNATSGYQKLPNGLILQWGTASGTATFPITFPNNCWNCVVQLNSSSASGFGANQLYLNSLTTTGFTRSDQSTNPSVRYFAIGN